MFILFYATHTELQGKDTLLFGKDYQKNKILFS